MGLNPVDESTLRVTLSSKKRRENFFLQHSLVFKHQSDQEIVCVNHARATLSCFEACRKHYLP
jgi:hypothetical protein